MSRKTVAVSAPGKVLLAGGYLVLDRAHTGLVFGLDARIHVVVQAGAAADATASSEIVVKSPQFEGAVWEYGYQVAEKDGGVDVMQIRMNTDLGADRNVFIETALSYALSYISKISSDPITPASVTILADNDYYSTPAELDVSAARQKFLHFGVPINKAHKTGLGSSAALVTSFVGAILSYYLSTDTFDLIQDASRRKLHNLAQAAHCAAQGKVGSGFDVASAVYGSCLYRRFSPSILSNHVEPGKPDFAKQIVDLVDERDADHTWDTQVRKDVIQVPRNLRLVLCDVSCGSQTPGMVKKVLAWRKEKPAEANRIWADLQSANDNLADQLKHAAEAMTKDYTALTEALAKIRGLLRLMSDESKVAIEPRPQTELLDACSAVPGVIGGVVPGAGGYDAITLLIENDESVLQELQRLFADWKFDAGIDGESAGKVGILGVREEMVGVRAESAEDYGRYMN